MATRKSQSIVVRSGDVDSIDTDNQNHADIDAVSTGFNGDDGFELEVKIEVKEENSNASDDKEEDSDAGDDKDEDSDASEDSDDKEEDSDASDDKDEESDASNEGTDGNETSLNLSKCWKCPVCKKVLTNARSKWQHLRTHSGELTTNTKADYVCPDCSSTFETRTSFRLHRKIHHPAIRTSIPCPECGETFENKKLLKKHVKLHTSASESNSGMDVECLLCFKSFATRAALGNHYILKHINDDGSREQLFRCPFSPCTKSYAGQGSLKEHILTHHFKTKLYNCRICQKEFARKDNMVKHLKSIHGCSESKEDDDEENHSAQDDDNDNDSPQQKSPHVSEQKCNHHKPSLSLDYRTPGFCNDCNLIYCNECSYTFASKKKFSGHTHDNFCIKCCVKFRNKKLYFLHLKYHLNHKKSIAGRCEECLLAFESDRETRNHLRIWHGKMLLSCPVCKKTFNSRNNLNVHKQIHKVRKWICKVCSKAFQTSARLKRHHKVMHSEIRWENLNVFTNMMTPIKSEVKVQQEKVMKKSNTNSNSKGEKNATAKEVVCRECNKVCPSAARLKIHMRVHSHICNICDKKFSRPRDLRLHQLIHMKDAKPYKCAKCPKSYLMQRELQVHMMNHHGLSPKHLCKTCSLPFSSKEALEKHIANNSCEKRKTSRKMELARRVEAARRKRRECSSTDDESVEM